MNKKYRNISIIFFILSFIGYILTAIWIIKSHKKDNGGLGGLNEFIIAIEFVIPSAILTVIGIVLLFVSVLKGKD